MRHATEYARKINRLYARLRQQHGKPQLKEPADPTDQLLLGILLQGTTLARARKMLDRIRSSMVDLNELRVSHPPDLVELMGSGFPHAFEKATQIVHALNQVYRRHHSPSLDNLKEKGKREALKAIEMLKGVDPMVLAGVGLMSFGGHSIPVDQQVFAVLQAEELVDPEATLQEVQAFLQRAIPASESYAFTSLFRRYSEERFDAAMATLRARQAAAQAAAAAKAALKAAPKASPKAVRPSAATRARPSKPATKASPAQKRPSRPVVATKGGGASPSRGTPSKAPRAGKKASGHSARRPRSRSR